MRFVVHGGFASRVGAWVVIGMATLVSGCGPAFQQAGPPLSEPHMERDRLITRDGSLLPLRHWQAIGPARGTIIALHSFTDYSAAFEQLGPWLASRGYNVRAYDQRGFGEAPHPGHWAGRDAMVSDLEDAIAVVRGSEPDLPLFLLGESMGGSVAMVAASRTSEPLEGLILAGPGVREGLPAREFWNAVFGTAAHVTPGLTVTVRRQRPSPLTPEAAARLHDDPLVIREVRADSYYGLLQLADQASAAAGEIEAPALILFGDQDRMIPEVSLCAALEALPGEKRLVVYEDAPHLVLQWQKHGPVWAELEHWLSARAGDATPIRDPEAKSGGDMCPEIAVAKPIEPAAAM